MPDNTFLLQKKKLETELRIRNAQEKKRLDVYELIFKTYWKVPPNSPFSFDSSSVFLSTNIIAPSIKYLFFNDN